MMKDDAFGRVSRHEFAVGFGVLVDSRESGQFPQHGAKRCLRNAETFVGWYRWGLAGRLQGGDHARAPAGFVSPTIVVERALERIVFESFQPLFVNGDAPPVGGVVVRVVMVVECRESQQLKRRGCLQSCSIACGLVRVESSVFGFVGPGLDSQLPSVLRE